jgi:peptidoglycan/LPS O-acetylase OafA/YrhL
VSLREGAPLRQSIDSLTSVRGLAALWIVFYHFWTDLLVLFPGLDALSPIVREGNYAVPLFFILSGFVLAYNYGDGFSKLCWSDYRRFVLLRFGRIYPVHLATLLAVLVMVILARLSSRPITEPGYTTATFFENLFLVQTWVPDFELNWNYPAWSISSEWFAYLWFPVLMVVLTRVKSVALAGILLGAAWAGAVLVYLTGPIPFRDLLVVIPTFAAGVIACRSWQLAKERRFGPRWLPDLCAVLIIAMPFITASSFLTVAYVSVFLLLVLTLATWTDACTGIWRWQPLIFLGEVSYSLYMTHTLVQKGCHVLLSTTWFAESHWLIKLGIAFAQAALIAGACLVVYWLIERPAREFFRSRWRRRSKAAAVEGSEPSPADTAVAPTIPVGGRAEESPREPAAHDFA